MTFLIGTWFKYTPGKYCPWRFFSNFNACHECFDDDSGYRMRSGCGNSEARIEPYVALLGFWDNDLNEINASLSKNPSEFVTL
jgi:hypothetical protein